MTTQAESEPGTVETDDEMAAILGVSVLALHLYSASGMPGPWDGPGAAQFIARIQGEAFAYWAERSP